MARNRRTVSAATRLVPALKVLLLCMCFVTAGVGYAWYKDQNRALGDEVKAREVQLEKLRQQNKISRDLLDNMCSPVELDRRIKQMNLTLSPPTLQQVIRINEAASAVPGAPPVRPVRAEAGN